MDKPGSKHPNIKEINHGLKVMKGAEPNMFEARASGNVFSLFKEMLPMLARDLYKVPEISELYKRKHEFDVIMIDALFNEVKNINLYD